MTYFAMLFSAGIGVGLFFYGVSEPLWHQSSHWFANAGYRSQDEIDMFAMNLTVFHWGITGWSQYLVVAICCGLASYRFNLPMPFPLFTSDAADYLLSFDLAGLRLHNTKI